MNFDKIIERRGTHCSKWDKMETYSGVSPEDGLAMWIADSDFETAPCVADAMRDYAEHAVYGYGFDQEGYDAAIVWWMEHRHGWKIEPNWIITVQGLGHAIGMAIDTWTQIGEGVAYFTPVYHEFRLKTIRAERRPIELPLALVDGRYQLDLDRAADALDPGVKLLLVCAPQNPSGRVWTKGEMLQIAEFAAEHNLIVISDEIHADLVYGPARHIPMALAAPDHSDRIVTITAASKTFNLPGLRTGQTIIENPKLHAEYLRRIVMTEYQPCIPGIIATKAAYTPEGEDYVIALCDYLKDNREVFDAGINAIPGLSSMDLEATYLAWVDFSGTGMSPDEITDRIRKGAKIAGSPGPTFGTGGETFHRFNIAMPRSQIHEAVARMTKAFSDLQ